ncbi:hypothetical protein PIIN_10088 [Serendipita indica DSM 11827]|uniref:DUF1264-domain-containing protein n=1 Tax=Serendipita indica (strain DSM 11827) TaxID=1109443 RepID=G4TXP5_SERID|nr:hypothetical protein PIIN_10088 [Serendipita indica DSM 11827]
MTSKPLYILDPTKMSQYENESKPDPAGTTSAMLELTAGATQDFTPVKSICAFLNAYHVYADDTARPPVDSYHYCAHIEPEMRQCIIYDSPRINARLIGIEYLISPRLYQTLPKEEKKLWHSHAYEVKSGMLIMAKPGVVPNVVWQAAENKEMEMLVDWYGKTLTEETPFRWVIQCSWNHSPPTTRSISKISSGIVTKDSLQILAKIARLEHTSQPQKSIQMPTTSGRPISYSSREVLYASQTDPPFETQS